MLLAATLAGTLAFAQAAAPQTDPTAGTTPPDCQRLLMMSAGPGVTQLCQAEAEMRRGEAAATDADERRKRLASAAAEFERAAGSLRDVALKIYAVETLVRLFDDTHLNEPREVEQALRSLIPLMPGNSSPLRRIATLQEAQGLSDAAENTLLGARQQMPDDIEVYRALSQFYGRRAAQMSTDHVRADRHGDPIPPNVEPIPQNVEPIPQNAEPVAQNSEPDADGFYSVGGNIPPPAPATPTVPALRSRAADAAGVTGVVILEIRVDETGAVSGARIVRSIPMLDEAALATVKQWRYAPTLIEGRAVPVKMTVAVNFGPPPK
jgi:TonB family protein